MSISRTHLMPITRELTNFKLVHFGGNLKWRLVCFWEHGELDCIYATVRTTYNNKDMPQLLNYHEIATKRGHHRPVQIAIYTHAISLH